MLNSLYKLFEYCQNTVLKDIIIGWKVILINVSGRYSHGFIV